LGIEHLFLENLWGSLTFYYSDAKDYIDFRTISATKSRMDNISEVEIRGVECELKWQITDEWSGNTFYTYNKSKVEECESDPTIEGNFLPYTLHGKYGLGLSFSNPRLFDFNLLFNYKDKRYGDSQNTQKLKSYCTVDLKVSKRFGKYCRFSIGVENLFDEEYTLYAGPTQDVITPGRVIMGSFDIKF